MHSNSPHILTINGGSSSIKFALFDAAMFATAGSLRKIFRGEIDKVGTPEARLTIKAEKSADRFEKIVIAPDQRAAGEILVEELGKRIPQGTLAAIGHRVVHGGPKYSRPEWITPELIECLRELSPFDPTHLPAEISLIESMANGFPDVPQVACFDTAFHHEIPRVAQMLPIPRKFFSRGVRRYGFHGLSYEFLMEELAQSSPTDAARERIVLAHLGNGASLAAVLAGKPVDTTMSLTPCGGVPMGTRTGDLDPGVIWYLANTEKMDVEQVASMANRQSGLLGISETNSDVRALLELENDDARAHDALAVFCYAIKKQIGAFAAAMGGIDTLVFSGGIGENSPLIRSRICTGLDFLGIEMAEPFNSANENVISTETSRVAVRVIRTDEEQMIARHTSRLLEGL